MCPAHSAPSYSSSISVPEGMPALRGGGAGDMFIELAVETPVNLTSKQKELLREFEDLSEDNNPESKTFFSSVKSFWDSMKG